MNKYFKDKRILIVYCLVIFLFIVGITYALQSTSLSLGLTTALVGIDEDAYGSTDFDSSELDFKPILDTEVETSTDNVIKIDFSVGGAETNNNENIIYDIALNALDVNCNLLSPYIKWKLVKDGTEISSGSLDYKFDTIDENGRLVLTTIQEDLPDYNADDKSGYDDYTFYMWFSDSCQESDITKCKSATDQSSLIGQNLTGRVEVELYTESKKELVRNPETTLSSSKCSGAYVVTLNTMGGTLSDDESTVKVIEGSNYGTLPTPTRVETVTFDTLGGSDIIEVNNTSEEAFVIGTSNTFGISPKTKLLSDTNSKNVTYTFEGWYKDKELTNPVTEETPVTQEKNHDLYAKWSADNITITLPSVTKTYCEFMGWYSDKTLKTKIGDAGDSYEVITSKTLYAGWDINYLPITLNDNEGTGGVGTIYVVPGEGFFSDEELTTQITSIITPTRVGYTFSGYTGLTDSDGNITASSEDFTEAVTLSAAWTINSYNVTYYSGNLFYGLDDISTTTSSRMSYSISNGTVTVTANYDDGNGFTMGRVYLEAGVTYTFNCTTSGTWGMSGDTVEGFLMKDGTYSDSVPYLWLSPGNTYTPTVSGTYWLRLDVNTSGKTYTFSDISISTVVNTTTLEYGSQLGTLPSFSSPGHTFAGWYTEENGGGTQISETTTVPAYDVNYYANWNLAYYSIGNNYYVNLGSAIAAASSGNEIVLITNDTDSSTATVDKNLTINTNGYTLTRTAVITVNSGVTCTIAGSGTLQSASQLFSNSGTLKITHTGVIQSTTDTVETFISNSGTVEKTGSGTISSSGCTINGGTVSVSAGTVQSVASSNNSSEERAINASSVTVSGGTVTGATYGIVGSATVTGGTVSGTYGICPLSGTLTITGGTVSGTSFGVVNWSGQTPTMTIGSSTVTLSTTSPVVTGGTYGIVAQTSSFNFYSGVIKGTNSTPYVGTASCRTGYSIRTSSASGVYSAYLGNTYTVTLDQQGATTNGTTSVTATYGSAMPSLAGKLPDKSFTVTYNANGGTVSTTSATATYTFGGYYTGTSGSGTQYYTSAGASARAWDIASNTTLYAKWTSSTVTLPTPTRAGYTFNGWYTATSGGSSVGAGGATYTPTSSLTIYAQWTQNNWAINSPASGADSLATAVSNANEGATLTLQKSYTETNGVAIQKNLYINFSTFTLTTSTTGAAIDIYSTVRFDSSGGGVTRIAAGYAITTMEGGSLTIGSGTYKNTAAYPVIHNLGYTGIEDGYFEADANTIQNGDGTDTGNIGTMWIIGGTFKATGSSGTAVFRNLSDQSSGCSQACSIHITGNVTITGTDTKMGALNSTTDGNGKIHFPGTFTGTVTSEDNYAIKATNGAVQANGGTYKAKSSSYFKSGTGATFGSSTNCTVGSTTKLCSEW